MGWPGLRTASIFVEEAQVAAGVVGVTFNDMRGTL
jgi:hypothetical protein